jgi:hypothetical protein
VAGAYEFAGIERIWRQKSGSSARNLAAAWREAREKKRDAREGSLGYLWRGLLEGGGRV